MDFLERSSHHEAARSIRRRPLSLFGIAAALALVFSPLAAAAPAHAWNGACVNTGCDALYDDAYAVWQDNWDPNPGGYGWWRAIAGHNCTNYVAWRLSLDGVKTPTFSYGNASSWDTSASSDGHSVFAQGATPAHVAVGRIAQWNGANHVSYIQEVSAGNYIVVWEDTYNADEFRIKKIAWNSAGWPDNIISFDGSDPVPQPGQPTIPTTPALASREWRYNNVNDSSSADVSFTHGVTGDYPVVGDWDGDGVDTEGVVRNGRWILTNSQGGGATDYSFIFGNGSDIPLVGDWDGDGIDTPALRRGAKFFISNSFTSGAAGAVEVEAFYGKPSDTPVVGDWDGDGIDSVGVVRNGLWILTNTFSSAESQDPFLYGKSGDVPLVGDWDGDGDDTPGVNRTNKWILTNSHSSANSLDQFAFGNPSDIPLIGDWDGDGSDSIGIAR